MHRRGTRHIDDCEEIDRLTDFNKEFTITLDNKQAVQKKYIINYININYIKKKYVSKEIYQRRRQNDKNERTTKAVRR